MGKWMKGTVNRRRTIGVLAASTTRHWVGAAHAATGEAHVRTSAKRVRPGAVIVLECADADGFELALDETAPKVFPAPSGVFRFRAPGAFSEGPWAQIRCTPLRAGRPAGPSTTVAVYVAFPGYGA